MHVKHSGVCVCVAAARCRAPAGKGTPPLRLTRASLTSRTRSTPLMTRFKAFRVCRMCPGNQEMLRDLAPIAWWLACCCCYCCCYCCYCLVVRRKLLWIPEFGLMMWRPDLLLSSCCFLLMIYRRSAAAPPLYPAAHTLLV